MLNVLNVLDIFTQFLNFIKLCPELIKVQVPEKRKFHGSTHEIESYLQFVFHAVLRK